LLAALRVVFAWDTVQFLQRGRITRNADRCNSQSRSVRLSVRHVPVFCPDEWRYDRAAFSIR